MAKLTRAGSGFIKYGDELINLIGYKGITKIDEMDDSMIGFTPFIPSNEDLENGVEGTWVITYETVSERDEDFKLIETVLAD
ncbi:hypothetical protein [Mucilaginibacter polytrichastri]|nr:hypothetical protein [Mucilaginibacter polytrichastri]SFT08395.1 hypothetical protein SAMN04487890_11028 [Mucilaginibacter polytrichastri]